MSKYYKVKYIILGIFILLVCMLYNNKYDEVNYKNNEITDKKFQEDSRGQCLSWGMKAVNFEEKYQDVNIKKIKIAILDSGINENHEDLDRIIKESVNFTRSSNDDKLNHGTAIAGIVGAENNNKGIIGILDIYSAKVIDDNGNCNISDLVKGLEWAISKDVDIINISIGFKSDSKDLKKAIDKAIDKNIIIVSSAGNKCGLETDYPAKYEKVISVGSINSNLDLSKFNSKGKIDFVAPGEDILSTSSQGDYLLYKGTSFSAPFATGIIGKYILHNNIKKDGKRIDKVYNYLSKNSINITKNSEYKLIQFIN